MAYEDTFVSTATDPTTGDQPPEGPARKPNLGFILGTIAGILVLIGIAIGVIFTRSNRTSEP